MSSSPAPVFAQPSTPTTSTTPSSRTDPTDPTASTANTARRSARVHKRDPIVAPGFGTQQDLETLATDLGQPLTVIQAVMASQGRGTRRSRGTAAAELPKAAAAVNTSAWANFLSEEHTEESTAKPSATTTAVETKPATREETSTTAPSTTSTTATTAGIIDSTSTHRTYELPLTPEWSNTAKHLKAKKAKTSTEGGGVLVQAGTLDATCIGRTKPSMDRTFDLKIPHVLLPRLTNIATVISSCNAAHALAIDTNGKVYGWGRNEASQLGAGLGPYVGRPFLLENLGDTPCVSGAVGKSHTIVLTKNQDLYAVGLNKSGQCGIKSSTETVSNFRKCVVMDANSIVQISCGEAFSVALDEDGYMYTCGSSEFGQLGNGETGERILTANKVTFDNRNVFERQSQFTHVPGEKAYGSGNKKDKVVEIQEDIRIANVACGRYHCIAMEAPSQQQQQHPPRVFSWGCGNYGCLGHGVQADEYKPRLIASLSAGQTWSSNPPVSCTAGSSCSMVLTKTGHVYYWGKHRSVGEAVMRPNILAELANNSHIAQHVGAGNQTVVISTKNAVTVAWGMGPHGELGFGDKKSSARPDFVSKLDKCRIQDLACGYGTTYYIIRKEDDDDEAAIKTLPVVSDETFIELENFVETVAASKSKK